MQRIKYRISLDMFEVASQTTIKAKKGDTACSIYATLMEKGKIYNISEGCHAVFSAKKPDGNYLFNGETCRIEDNTIIYDFTEQTTPIEGIVECELILYKGEDKLTSPRFNLKIDATVYNGEDIVSTPEADALKELTDRAEAALVEIENGLNQIPTLEVEEVSDGVKFSVTENGETHSATVYNGKDAVVDQTYSPTSKNAQSGVAVAEAIDKNNQSVADALKATVSGETISIDDMSPIKHNVEVSVQNYNLWNAETTCSFIQSKEFDISLPIGSYTFSALVTSQDTDSDVCLVYDKTNEKTLGRLPRGKRSSISFELTVPTNKIILYSSTYNNQSAGDESNWKDIQLERGYTATEFSNVIDLSTVIVQQISSKNLFDKDNPSILDAYFHNTNGIVMNASNKSIYIPCLPNTIYTVSKVKTSRFNVCYSYEFPREGLPVYGRIATNDATSIQIATDDKARFLLVLFRQAIDTLSVEEILDTMQIEVGSTATDYEPYVLKSVHANEDGTVDGFVSEENVLNLRTNKPNIIISCTYNQSLQSTLRPMLDIKNALKKTIVFMGDSILGNITTDTGVVNWFKKLTGHNCYNFAFGGTRAVTRPYSTSYAPFAFDSGNISNAIITNDFSEQEKAIATGSQVPEYYAGRLKDLVDFCAEDGFAKADILVINWGTNDWNGSNHLDTYYKALSDFITAMQTAFSNLIIVKMTPTQRFIEKDGVYKSGNTILTTNGDNLWAYCEKDKKLSTDFNIQVIDCYNIGINDYNKDMFFNDNGNNDYTHHGEKGRKRLAEILAKEIV